MPTSTHHRHAPTTLHFALAERLPETAEGRLIPQNGNFDENLRFSVDHTKIGYFPTFVSVPLPHLQKRSRTLPPSLHPPLGLPDPSPHPQIRQTRSNRGPFFPSSNGDRLIWPWVENDPLVAAQEEEIGTGKFRDLCEFLENLEFRNLL